MAANLGRTFQQDFRSHGDLPCVRGVAAKLSPGYLNFKMDKSIALLLFKWTMNKRVLVLLDNDKEIQSL